MVGARGFEPPTLWSQTRCATRLRHAPAYRYTVGFFHRNPIFTVFAMFEMSHLRALPAFCHQRAIQPPLERCRPPSTGLSGALPTNHAIAPFRRTEASASMSPTSYVSPHKPRRLKTCRQRRWPCRRAESPCRYSAGQERTGRYASRHQRSPERPGHCGG